MISKTSAGCVPGGVPVFVFMQSFKCRQCTVYPLSTVGEFHLYGR